MKYYLDTNICIFFLRGVNLKLKKKLLSMNPQDIKIPSLTKAELLYGAEKSQKKDENIKKIGEFLFPFNVIGFNDNESIEYSKIRAELEMRGEKIGPNDTIIAAIVKTNNGTLVTNNTREFKKIPDLKIVDWSVVC